MKVMTQVHPFLDGKPKRARNCVWKRACRQAW